MKHSIIIALLLALLLLAGCSNRDELEVTSRGEEESSSQVEYDEVAERPYTGPDIPREPLEDEGEEESSEESGASSQPENNPVDEAAPQDDVQPDPDEPEGALGEAQPAIEEPEASSAPTGELSVTLTRQSILASGSVTITDQATVSSILYYIDSLTSGEAATASTGEGGVIHVSVSRNGRVEQYSFTNQKTRAGQIMAKNAGDSQTWLLADGGAYDYLAGLFG